MKPPEQTESPAAGSQTPIRRRLLRWALVVLGVVVVVLVTHCAIRIGGTVSRVNKAKLFAHQMAVGLETQYPRGSAAKVRDMISRRAHDLGLPVEPEDVEILMEPDTYAVELRYEQPIGCLCLTYDWQVNYRTEGIDLDP